MYGSRIGFSVMGLNRTPIILALVAITFVVTIGLSVSDVQAQSVKQVNVIENKFVTLIGTGIDPDTVDDLTFFWTQLDGEPVLLSSYTVQEPQFLAPSVPNGQVKILTFSFRVTDPYGATDADTIQIIVNPVNDPPTVDAGKDKIVYPGVNTVTFFGSGSDPDKDNLSYSWRQVSGEPGKMFYKNSKYLTLVTSYEEIFDISEPLEFEITVNDGHGGSDTDTAALYPFGFGKNDRGITVDAGPLQVVNEGSTVTLRGTGENTKGLPMTYHWKQNIGPDVTLSSRFVQNPTFVAPQLEGDDNVLVSFLLTGHAETVGSATDLTIVKVVSSNGAPIANAGVDQIVNEKTRVGLACSGTDPDGDEITMQWKQIAGEPVQLSTLSTTNPSFVSPDVMNNESKTLTFECTVTDPYRRSSTDSVNIEVSAINRAPFANAGVDLTVTENTRIQLAGFGNDPDQDIVTYEWKQLGGEQVSLSDTSIPGPTFIAPDVDANVFKTMTFELRVTDPYGLSDSDIVQIRTVSQNQSPTASAGPDQNVNEGSLVSLTCTGADPDNDHLTYMWRQVSGEPVVISDPNQPTITFTAPATMTTGQLVFECTVSDGVSASSDTVIVNYRHVISTPLVADAGPDRIVNEEITIALDGSASFDPENQPLSYEWTQVSGESVTLSSNFVVNPTFVTPVVANEQIKELVFEIRVYDLGGRQDTDTVTIVVDPINAEPVATANARQS